MKKINFFIIIIFIATNVFAQSSLYLGTTKEEFIFKPPYIILGEIEITDIDNNKIGFLTNKDHALLESRYWGGISYYEYKKNRFITPKNIKIANSDIFPDYMLYDVTITDDNPRWIPIWYFDALQKRDRNIIVDAEPKRTEWDADIAPSVWYMDIPQVASIVLTNLGFMFYTPLYTKNTGFLFGEVKRKSKNIYEVIAYPAIQDVDEKISWEPNKENFPHLQDGNPVQFRFEINEKSMKIYNADNNKICFDLIQVNASWVKLYETFVQTNKIPFGLSLPGEYLHRTYSSINKQSIDTPRPSVSAVTVNKRYRASDNLRLRSSGSTAGKPVVTIGKGPQVKVLGIGAEQTIDGITSNWVQVEVQAGAKDRDGKAIAAGTTGWCFGGYLAER